MNCYKCFRKSLLEKVMTNSPINDKYLDELFQIKDVKRVLATKHLHYGNVITYITSHYHGKLPEMLALKKKTRGDRLDVSWMNKWYPDAEEFLAPKYRDEVKKRIFKYVKPMNQKDIQTMKKSFSKFITRQELLNQQWSEEYKQKQHKRGKLTARERIQFLLRYFSSPT